MKEDIEDEKDIINFYNSKKWVLKSLINLADSKQSFQTVIEKLHISGKETLTTDFLIGFGEGFQILLSLLIQDILDFPTLYGFKEVSKELYERFYFKKGLFNLNITDDITFFLREIGDWILKLDSGKYKNSYEILEQIKYKLMRIYELQEQYLEYSSETKNGKQSLDDINDFLVRKTIFWDFLTSRDAAGHIHKLWGEIPEEKLTVKQQRRSIFYRGLPKLTKHPNARQLNFQGYLTFILIFLSITIRKPVALFFEPDSKYNIFTRLKSWEPIDNDEYTDNLFDQRVEIGNIIDVDLPENAFDFQILLKEDFSFPHHYDLQKPPALNLDTIFGCTPIITPKELSHSIFAQSFLRYLTLGLIDELGEKYVEIILFLHPLDENRKKEYREVREWTEVLPELTTYMEGDISYSISVAILIPSSGSLFNYSKWIILYEFGSNEVMDSYSDNQGYFFVKNLIESFNLNIKKYVCNRKYFSKFIKTTEVRIIEKAQHDFRESRNNLRGVIAEFLVGYIYSSYKSIPLKIRQIFGEAKGDLDLVGLIKKDNSVEILIFEIKDISKSGRIRKDIIQDFLINLKSYNLKRICQNFFGIKANLPIRCKGYFVTTQFFVRAKFPSQKGDPEFLQENEIKEYINSQIDKLNLRIEVNYISYAQIKKIVKEMNINSAFNHLLEFWNKVEWFENELAI